MRPREGKRERFRVCKCVYHGCVLQYGYIPGRRVRERKEGRLWEAEVECASERSYERAYGPPCAVVFQTFLATQLQMFHI